ncbi:hypothetical protein ACI1MP_18120 [Kitasatospora griseola]|uniref:hypothetical protein n=1 Tax=Kitasatospora griseola TaxID=2064 RepID=UPI0038558425
MTAIATTATATAATTAAVRRPASQFELGTLPEDVATRPEDFAAPTLELVV